MAVASGGAYLLGRSKVKTRSTSRTQSNSITVASDIPISKRKSDKYYPACRVKNTIAIDFLRPMNLASAEAHVLSGKDVYTFMQGNARMLALNTGGSVKNHENHALSPKSKSGIYFTHYHGVGVSGQRVHIFFDLPIIKP